MKLGLQFYSYSWPGGPEAIGPTLARSAQFADEAGFDSLWVMDHLWQIDTDPAQPMLEGWTTLGFLAAHTRRARLGLMVGGIHHRSPALWVKAATTLDVLSGGRAWLGLGAGWNDDESNGLGIPFPTFSTRYELLEDALRYAHLMWEGERGSDGPFEGRHVTAARLLNVPQSLSRPRVPIMIGGSGERRTLRLVARYADATNLSEGPEVLRRKLRVLAAHCEEIGRPFDAIERTVLQSLSLGEPSAFEEGDDAPSTPAAIVDRLGRLAEAGAQHVIFNFRRTDDLAHVELLAATVMPQVRALRAADPVGSSGRSAA
jgi:F420-dependent oxidoreductase-like protein